jgi:hypothetical protein
MLRLLVVVAIALTSLSIPVQGHPSLLKCSNPITVGSNIGGSEYIRIS